MPLIKLTNRNGNPIWINPAQVMTLEPVPIYVDRERVGDQTLITFAVAGRSTEVEGTTDHELHCERMTESPDEVAGRMLSPLGVPA